MKNKPLAFDLMFVPDTQSVQEALHLHDNCPLCRGAGGNSCYDPEVPCAGCGFNVFDSARAEDIPRNYRPSTGNTIVGVLASPWNINRR